jgi:acyl carrier protein
MNTITFKTANLEILRAIINETTDFKDKIGLKDHLRNDLYIDSFDMLMVVRAIEDKFSIQIEDQELENIETVGDIVKKLDNLNLFQNESEEY